MSLPLLLDPSTTRVLGEATMIVVGAFVLGYIVSRIMSNTRYPRTFGAVAAFAAVGLLAYLGSKGAGVALVVLIAGAVLFGVAGLVM